MCYMSVQLTRLLRIILSCNILHLLLVKVKVACENESSCYHLFIFCKCTYSKTYSQTIWCNINLYVEEYCRNCSLHVDVLL